jgi:hypothetical protein
MNRIPDELLAKIQRLEERVATRTVLAELEQERRNQDAKWGEQNHPVRWPESTYEDRLHYLAQAELWKKRNAERVRLANEAGATPDRNCSWDGILLEEVYEALAEGDPAAIRAELVQAGAVIVAMIESLDRNWPKSAHGLPVVEPFDNEHLS